MFSDHLATQRPDNARLLEGHLMKILQTRGAPAEKVGLCLELLFSRR